jgi:quinol monooxygenase YgiN
MKSAVCIEIAEFAVLPAVDAETLISIAGKLEEAFHARQSGYMDSELVKDSEEGRWLMIQHWESAEHAVSASRNMMKDAAAEEFRNAVDPKSVKIRYHKQCGRW